MTDPELERELNSPTLPASQGRELSPEALAALRLAIRRRAVDVKLKRCGLRDSGLQALDKQKPGPKPKASLDVAAAEARADIAAGVPRKRAVLTAAERHGVKKSSVETRLYRQLK